MPIFLNKNIFIYMLVQLLKKKQNCLLDAVAQE